MKGDDKLGLLIGVASVTDSQRSFVVFVTEIVDSFVDRFYWLSCFYNPTPLFYFRRLCPRVHLRTFCRVLECLD